MVPGQQLIGDSSPLSDYLNEVDGISFGKPGEDLQSSSLQPPVVKKFFCLLSPNVFCRFIVDTVLVSSGVYNSVPFVSHELQSPHITLHRYITVVVVHLLVVCVIFLATKFYFFNCQSILVQYSVKSIITVFCLLPMTAVAGKFLGKLLCLVLQSAKSSENSSLAIIHIARKMQVSTLGRQLSHPLPPLGGLVHDLENTQDNESEYDLTKECLLNLSTKELKHDFAEILNVLCEKMKTIMCRCCPLFHSNGHEQHQLCSFSGQTLVTTGTLNHTSSEIFHTMLPKILQLLFIQLDEAGCCSDEDSNGEFQVKFDGKAPYCHCQYFWRQMYDVCYHLTALIIVIWQVFENIYELYIALCQFQCSCQLLVREYHASNPPRPLPLDYTGDAEQLSMDNYSSIYMQFRTQLLSTRLHVENTVNQLWICEKLLASSSILSIILDSDLQESNELKCYHPSEHLVLLRSLQSIQAILRDVPDIDNSLTSSGRNQLLDTVSRFISTVQSKFSNNGETSSMESAATATEAQESIIVDDGHVPAPANDLRAGSSDPIDYVDNPVETENMQVPEVSPYAVPSQHIDIYSSRTLTADEIALLNKVEQSCNKTTGVGAPPTYNSNTGAILQLSLLDELSAHMKLIQSLRPEREVNSSSYPSLEHLGSVLSSPTLNQGNVCETLSMSIDQPTSPLVPHSVLDVEASCRLNQPPTVAVVEQQATSDLPLSVEVSAELLIALQTQHVCNDFVYGDEEEDAEDLFG